MRKVVFWIHLVLALGAGLVVGLLALTGILLSFEKQMAAWADPAVKPGTAMLPVETLAEKAVALDPALAAATVTISSDPTHPVAFAVGREKRLLLDPYTGTSLGEGGAGTRATFRSIIQLHRWLALESESVRPYGKAITGAVNLIFVLILLTGLFIWWPKKFAWRNFKVVLFMRFDVRGKARDWNWHHALGFWAFIPLLAMSLTGLVISYDWAGNALNYAVGAAPNPPRAERPATEPPKPPTFTADSVRGFDAMIATAKQQNAQWQTLLAKLPSSLDKSIVVTIDTGTGAQPQYKTLLTVDRNGSATKSEPFTALPIARKARLTARFLHTGELLGLFGQFVFGLCCLACVILIWTGFALSWRRFFSRARVRAVSNESGLDDVPASQSNT